MYIEILVALCICGYIYICISICKYVCMHIYTYIYLLYVYDMANNIYIYTDVFYTCVYVYIYIYIVYEIIYT